MVTNSERQPPGTSGIPVSSLDELRAEIRRYRPVQLLARCRWLSLKLSENRSGPLELSIPAEIDKFGLPRVIRVTPHVVTLIARLSLIDGNRFAADPSDLDFLRILRIVSELYEEGHSGIAILLRTWEEQTWYQRSISHAIGRGLMWYRDIPLILQDPEIDLPRAFESEMGMNVDDFYGCAFLAFSLASNTGTTPYQYYTTIRPQNLTERAQALLASDVMRQFLSAASVDQRGFQELAQAWNPDTGGAGRYDLNPLWERPLIEIEGSGHIAPAPDLLIWMMDEQPYWRLRTALRGDGTDQPFGRFFGKHIFERYVGELLADRMPWSTRLAEDDTVYGRQNRRGPDWLVVQGEVGIAIELVLATMPRLRDGEEEEILRGLLADRVAPRVSNLPAKIQGLIAGRPDLGLDRVRRWHRLVVTKSPLPWIGLIKPGFLDQMIDAAAMPYHVLSVEEFETLLAAEQSYGVAAILDEAERDAAANADFRQLCRRIYDEKHEPFYYGRLMDLADEFFDQFLPTRTEP